MTKDEAMKLALEALRTLHDENMDYLTRNKLGGENNQCMVFARETIAALRTALEQPEQEPTVPDNMQDWANLDGDIAWHLIERHADNWADIKKMMDEFVSAKIASAQSKDECETCANKRKRLEQSGFLKSPLRNEK